MEEIKIINRILELKKELADTDYKAIKFAEGLISAEEYEPTKQQRIEWRNQINELEAELNEVENETASMNEWAEGINEVEEELETLNSSSSTTEQQVEQSVE